MMLMGIFFIPLNLLFSQHSSRNNYTGNWETPASWDPQWAVPQTIDIGGMDIAINGYITVNGNLSFSGLPTNLIINDTLVIKGNLTLDNFNNLTVNGSGIIIIDGNFYFNNNAIIITNNYIVVTGNIYKGGPLNKGSFISNSNPSKLLVSGTVFPANLTLNLPNYPVFNCTVPVTNPYTYSNCRYGNLNDLINDPIYPFVRSICTAITPVISADGPTAFCAGGSVTLTCSPATSYLWSNGATTRSINVTSAGSYTVQVIDAGGCQSAPSSASIVTVNPLPAAPTITAGGPTAICTGGSVSLTSSAGTSYLWSNGATKQNINITTAGSYTVQITDSKGCQSASSSATIVTVNSLPTVNAGADITIPNGTNTTINATVTGDGPFTYNWSPSDKLVNSFIEDPTTVNLSATTVFTLTATSAATTCSGTKTVTISISGGPLTSNASVTPGTICAGTIIQLKALAGGGSASYTYSWTSTPAGFTSSVADPTAVPVVNTTYNVAVSDGFTTVNSQVAVIVNPLPATPSITAGGPTTFCTGGSVILSSSPGTAYLWSDGATTESINVATAGSYTVKVSNASGCQSAASSASIVTVNPIPPKPTITAEGPTAICAGGSISLTSSAGTSYLWSNGATTQNLNITTAGSYTVQVKDANGCESVLSSATLVTVTSLPTVSAGTVITIPNGTNTTIDATVNGAGPFTYSWSPSDKLVNSFVEDPTTVNLTATTVFTLTATSVTTLCANSNTVIISVSGGPLTSNALATPGTICAGSVVQLKALAGGGSGSYSYSWTSTPAGFTSSVADPTADPVVNTTYNVAVSDGFTTVNSQFAVTVNSLPATPAITAGGPTTFCAGGSVSLSSSPGTAYLWSNGATTQNINITTVGSYTVQVIHANGCQSQKSDSIQVNINPLPVVTAGSNSPVCVGNTLNLSSSGGTVFDWSGPNGFKSNIQNPSIASVKTSMSGIYKVDVTSAQGCTVTYTLYVDIKKNPVAYAGADQNLKFFFETEMNAELSASETGEWTLVSGSGLINDIHSPLTGLKELGMGKNVFIWEVISGTCKASDEVIISVEDLFIPSVITPDGDGKNEFFIINYLTMPGAERAELIILNKWGSVEYRNKNYVNDWDGKNDRGNDLENDTYLYVLRFENGMTRKGTVLITR